MTTLWIYSIFLAVSFCAPYPQEVAFAIAGLFESLEACAPLSQLPH